MAIIEINNRNFATKISCISAGDTVLLVPGNYKEPLVLRNLIGTRERPIIIRCIPDETGKRAVFQSDKSDRAARLEANQIARKREKSGYYPTVAHLGEQALLILKECHFVIIEGLDFNGCWPSGIFIDNSKYVVINSCHFLRGTLAIVAQGSACHDIVIQNCHWKQDDSSDHKMWNSVLWDRIHGAANNSKLGGVDLVKDYRHWDGDFFRAWNVQSNFTFRNNKVIDAFNGIHFFNSRDRLAPGVKANSLKFNGGRQSTANVLIENNEFVRVRDNVFEPEDHAWNWVIRHNKLLDCYRPFSFEFERAGWIYVYGNCGAFTNRPTGGTLEGDDNQIPLRKRRRTPSLVKLNLAQQNEGPINFFNNSWFFKRGKGLFPKMQLGKLRQYNNATQFEKPDKDFLFGKLSRKPSQTPPSIESELADEEARFTRRWTPSGIDWETFDIQFDGDMCNDTFFPTDYKTLGYQLGSECKLGNPRFKNAEPETIEELDLTATNPEALGASIKHILDLPDSTKYEVSTRLNLGAVQSRDAYKDLDAIFEFLPDLDWFPELEKRAFPKDVPQTS